MSYREKDFAGEIAITLLIHKAKGSTAINSELGTITTALAADTSTHDKTIQNPPAALQILTPPAHTRFTNDINLVINKGKGGNLSNATMVAAIDVAIGVAVKPGVVDIPYASANATPPIVGTVCSVTNGNWVGVPTCVHLSMDPQRDQHWQRDLSDLHPGLGGHRDEADPLCGDGDQRLGLDRSAAVQCY